MSIRKRERERDRKEINYINTSPIKIISSKFKGNDKKERQNFIMSHIRIIIRYC